MSGSPDDPVVRVAVPGDADEIARIHVESWQATYRGIVPDPILDGLSVDDRGRFWTDAVGTGPEDGVSVWVLEAGGSLVGFASVGRARDDDLPEGAGELYAIHLARDAWSRGWGRRLLARVVDDLESRGFGPLVLWVLAANQRARRFYENQGWDADGPSRVLDFDGSPIEEVRFRRP